MSDPSAGRSSVRLRILRLPHGAGLPLPTYHSEHASGLDLLAALSESEPLDLGPRALSEMRYTGHALHKISSKCGIFAEADANTLLKAGVTVLNSPGTVDADYRGEVMVLLVNLGAEPFVVRRGDRIAQLVIARVEHVEIEAVDALQATARGQGGFGSTG